MSANKELLFDIKGLCKNFGELKVLKNIDETICKGDVVVIIGPSGSGKSTFIRCLNLLEQPTAGTILYKGENIIDTDRRWEWSSSSSISSTI